MINSNPFCNRIHNFLLISSHRIGIILQFSFFVESNCLKWNIELEEVDKNSSVVNGAECNRETHGTVSEHEAFFDGTFGVRDGRSWRDKPSR